MVTSSQSQLGLVWGMLSEAAPAASLCPAQGGGEWAGSREGWTSPLWAALGRATVSRVQPSGQGREGTGLCL